MAVALARERKATIGVVDVGGRPDRVAQQVEHRLREQLGIGVEVQRLGLDLDPRIDVASGGVGEREAHDLLGPGLAP